MGVRLKRFFPFIFILLLVCASSFSVLRVEAQVGEVTFKGRVVSDEWWSSYICYGSYVCIVSVEEILSDPHGILSLNDSVPLCYYTYHGFLTGELVECFGFYYYSGGCPISCCGYCVCESVTWPYYVVRIGPVENLNTGFSYETIQDAIDANETLDGHTIYVQNRTYYENVVVNKSLTLLGENSETTVLDGSGVEFFPVVHIFNVTDVLFEGFTIQNTSSSFLDSAGVSIYQASNVTVQSCIVKECYYGVLIGESTDCQITNNEIGYNFAYGVDFRSASNSNLIKNNHIIHNPTGIFIEQPSCEWNTFYHNNIVNNTNQVSTFSDFTHWDDGCEGNYWSDYESRYPNTSYDTFGIWNTSYVIDGNNQDNYPLRNLFWIPADTDHDLKVDIFDIVKCAACYCIDWEEHFCHVDINEPYGIVDIYDIVMICSSYGEEYGT